MNTDIQLSTRFLTTQNAHQVGMLVTVTGEKHLERPPINVALVLDRSGSMAGRPIEEAKEAALRFAQFLGAQDRLAVVTFETQVETVYGPGPADDPEIEYLIRGIQPAGTTNLSGGWLKGREYVRDALVEGTNRVVLLTDGVANEGITDPGKLTELARGAASDSVSTTCIGFGEHFNEDLLKAMGDAGSGNYWYIENIDQMGGIFEEEIENLVTLAAQNLELEVRLTHPSVAGVSFLQPFDVHRSDEGYVVRLGDVYATSPRALGLIFHVENVEQLGDTPLGEVRVKADVLRPDGVEHVRTTMPVQANLDEHDHVEPDVDRTLVRFEAATARAQAVKQADEGDYDAAAQTLRTASAKLSPYRNHPNVAEEIEDLDAESERLAEGEYLASDRKYHLSRSAGSADLRDKYLGKLSRRKKKK